MDKNFKEVKPLKYWVQNILPQVYTDSLSYQELLYKVVTLLNELTETNNNLPAYISEMIQTYISSGAIGEVVQNILSEYMLNVKNPPMGLKGAVGDGTEDDTEAIQGCIDYANENGGKAIYFPSGRYLSKGLTLKDNVALVGFDRYSTKIVMRGGSLKPLFGGVCNNVTINRLTLDGNMDIQTENLNLIDISGGNYLINDVEMTDGYDLLKVNLNGNLQLENIVFKHGVENAIVLEGNGKVVGNNLMFNSLSDLLGKHIIDNSVDGVVFDNLYSDCMVDTAINNTADNTSFTGQLVNNVNNITDSGNNTYYNFYGKGGSLKEAIDNEVVARIEADEILEGLINDEVLDRIEDSTVLQQNIEAETLARTNADTLLQDNIEAETLARTEADDLLQDNIESETLARDNADKELDAKISKLKTHVNVKDFGAKGDGVTDDTLAIQSAIDSLPIAGGVVHFPTGIYITTDTIKIGNGTASAVSTKHAIALVGDSNVATNLAPYDFGYGSRIYYKGLTGKPIVKISGPILSPVIKNISLWGNNVASHGIHLICCGQGVFDRVTVSDVTEVGILMDIWEGLTVTGTANNIQNVFTNIFVNVAFNNNAVCLKATAHAETPVIDSNMCSFKNMFLLYSGTGGVGIYLGFIDASQFDSIHCYRNGAINGSKSIVFDGTEIAGYPHEITFTNFSSNPDGYEYVGEIGNITFLQLLVGDGTVVPNHPKIRGITSVGQMFGQFFNTQQVIVQKESPSVALINNSIDSQTRVIKNGNATVDYGTAIEDVTDGVLSTISFSKNTMLFNGKELFDSNNPNHGVWVSATLVNEWTGTTVYSKNNRGQLFVKGTILGGVYTWGTTICTLPVGYRPTNTKCFDVYLDNGEVHSGFVLKPNGDIVVCKPLSDVVDLTQSIEFNFDVITD